MKRQTIILTSLLFLTCSVAYAQQVKIKKDIVYLDKEPSFQVVKTGDKGIGEAGSFAFLTLSGDTMVWFNGASLYLPELKHEKLRYRHTYYTVTYAGSGEETEYRFTGKQNLAEMLTETGLVKNGQLDKVAIPAFVAEQEKQKAVTQAFRENMAFRGSLLQHPEYPAYQKSLVERAVTGDVLIEGKKILVTASSGPVTIAIFRVLETPSDITYNINQLTGHPRAKIQYNKQDQTVSVKTIFDDAERKIDIGRPLDMAAIYDAVQYLMRRGYL